MAGVAAACEGRAKVVAVEPEGIPTLNNALSAGRPIDVSVSGIAVDSLGARRIGDIGFASRNDATSKACLCRMPRSPKFGKCCGITAASVLNSAPPPHSPPSPPMRISHTQASE